MALSFDDLFATTEPTTITVSLGSAGPVSVTYDRNAFTDELASNIYKTGIRDRLKGLLLGWDITRDGQPWQPADLDDPMWESRARAARVALLLVGAQRRALAADPAVDLDTISLTDAERTAAEALPVTHQERRAAYAAAWDELLAVLPVAVNKAIDAGVLDDFLGGRWRRSA